MRAIPDDAASATADTREPTGGGDFLPQAGDDAAARRGPDPLPWRALSRSECLMLALALHRTLIQASAPGGRS